MIFSSPKAQALVAWLYLVVIAAAWWSNTPWLLIAAAIVFIGLLIDTASRSTYWLMGTLIVICAAAFWLSAFPWLTGSILIQLAVQVLLWSQLATLMAALIVRWTIKPQPGQSQQQQGSKNILPK